MSVASIVPLVFLPQIPGATEGQEDHEIRQDPHQDVVSDDATDTDADDLGNLVLGVSIHVESSCETSQAPIEDAWLWLG